MKWELTNAKAHSSEAKAEQGEGPEEEGQEMTVAKSWIPNAENGKILFEITTDESHALELLLQDCDERLLGIGANGIRQFIRMLSARRSDAYEGFKEDKK